MKIENIKKIFNIDEIYNGYYKTQDEKYVFVYQFEPSNFELLSDVKKAKEVSSFATAISTLSFARVYILDQHDDLRYFANELREGYNSYTPEQQELVDEIHEKYTGTEYFEKKYYITYSSNELKDYKTVLKNLRDGGILINELGFRGIETFLYNLYNRDHQENNYHFYSSNALERLLPSNLEFKSHYIKCDMQFRKYYMIKDIPSSTSLGYLKNLVSTRNINIMIATEIGDQNKIAKSFQTRMGYTNSKKNDYRIAELERMTSQIEYEQIKQVIDEMLTENYLFVTYDLIIELTANNQKEFDDLKSYLSTRIINMGMKLDSLDYKQKDTYMSFIDTTKQIENMYKHVNISRNFASLYPFNKSTKIESNGIYYGQALVNNNPEGMIILNPISRTLKNYNVAVIGSSGSGKSVTLKKILFNISLRKNSKIFSFDSDQQEYYNVTNAIGGVNLEVQNQSLNILDFSAEEGSTNHISAINNVKKFMRIINGAFNDNDMTLLEVFMEKLYYDFHIIEIKNEKMVTRKLTSNTKFPLFSDLYKLIDNHSEVKAIRSYERGEELNINKESYEMLKTTIYSLAFGVNSNLFNKPTSVKPEGKAINFDVTKVREYDTNIFNALLYQYLTYIWDYVSNPNNSHEFKVIMIDELHLFVNPDCILATKEIRKMIKRIRKYLAGMIVATQEFADLMHDEIKHMASSILANTSTKFIYDLGDIAHEDIKDIIDITKDEYDLIQKSRALEGLIRFGHERYYYKLDLLNAESKYFGDAGR